MTIKWYKTALHFAPALEKWHYENGAEIILE
jgi:hypothetical protein